MSAPTPLPLTTPPQIAKNERPEVVAAVDAWWAEIRRAEKAALEFAAGHGDGTDAGFYGGPSMGKYVVVGLAGSKPTGGQWKEARRGWEPYKRNPVRAEFDALTVPLPAIPGLPSIVMGEGYLMEPRPFAHNGVSYYRLPRMPRPERYGTDATEAGWIEIKASEYYAAREAFDEKAVA